MKSSKKTYQEVAEACSKYQPVSEEYGFKNSSCECNTPSCLNCTHFTDQEHCDLDLYDQIVERIKLLLICRTKQTPAKRAYPLYL